MGEMLDVDMAESKEEARIEDITDMYRYKTARYSFSLPFMMGAILAEAPQEVITTLDTMGEQMGIVFQIKDDELGLVGNEAETGKPVGSDIKENKKTIHRALLFQKANAEEQQFLASCFGNNALSKEDNDTVITLLSKYSIMEEVQKITDSYEAKITDCLQNLPISGEYRAVCSEIIDLITKRKK